MAWHGKVRSVMVWQARFVMIWLVRSWLGRLWQAWLGKAKYGRARQCEVQLGRLGLVGSCMVGSVKTRLGMAGMAQHG